MSDYYLQPSALGLAAFLAAACLARRIRDAIDDTFRGFH